MYIIDDKKTKKKHRYLNENTSNGKIQDIL